MGEQATRRQIRFLPTTPAGRGALVVFVLAVALLFARFAHVPSINYLVVLIATALSGVGALFAVLFRERAVAVWVVLAVGVLAGAVLLLETISPPA